MTQSDIINNNFNKAFECIKCSNAYDTGIVLSEEKLFKQISERKRSTFDKSKFTVVGSPTITDDGVASGFSSTSFIESKNTYRITTSDKVIITGSFITGKTKADGYGILSGIGPRNNGIVLYTTPITSTTFLLLHAFGTDIVSIRFDEVEFIPYQKYYYMIEKNLNSITLSLKKEGDTSYFKRTGTFQGDDPTSVVDQHLTCGRESALTYSIDAKYASLEINGKEVFSGNKTGLDIINNIEIPYTLSKTGSKIVDVAYRDRVIDLYEQEGKAGYYTIDEINKNFTLPMGEVYGMIEDTKANIPTVDSALSSTSINPVQNKVINTALAGKANTSHNHNTVYQYWVKQTIDLSNTTTYADTKWFPVTGTTMQGGDMRRILVDVELNSGTKPSWSTHNSGFSVILDMFAIGSGWGTTTAASVCLQQTASWVSDASKPPASFSQMTNTSTPVLWLRGGGKYFVWTNYACTWTPRTATYTASNQSVTPTTTYPALSFNKSTIWANLNGNSATATKATQDSSGQQINTTYVKGVTASNATITVTKGNGTTSTATINNVANATKATQDSSGNQINTSYIPLKYSKYSISTYASSNPYIKLATFTVSNTQNYDNSILFWVEILTAGTAKAYALCKLSARWGGTSYAGTSFEILEKYGEPSLFKLFDTLTWAYKYTTASSKGSVVGEIWMSTHPASYVTYYLRPTECNEYGDYSMTPVTMASNPWTYYNKGGTSTSIASTAITSGYTQVKITDKSIRCYEPLLSYRWSDHILNDQSWLRADTFSWQDGNTYSLVYNELLSEYNNSASVTKTERGITYKRTPKGYKIALASQETAIVNKYNSDGIAWYYILDNGDSSAEGGKPDMGDTTNKRFKLPRTKFGFEGLRTSVGDDIAESLPNITGEDYIGWSGVHSGIVNNSELKSGCFVSPTYTGRGEKLGGAPGGNASTPRGIKFDASSSSSTYQDNAPVQERATQMYLYFYVGNFTESAEAQTAGLNSELLNSKVDISSLTECQVVIDTYVNGTSGYRIWSDGYCEQWGNIPFTATGGWTSGTITFLKPFKDTNYYINGRGNWSNRESSTFGLNSKTTTNFNVTVAINTLTNENGAWYACGYLAKGEY